MTVYGVPTRDELVDEAQQFLAVCIKTAQNIVELENMTLAKAALVDAILKVSEFNIRLEQELELKTYWGIPQPKKGGVGI